MDTILFSNNDHVVLGMYFITPFVFMFAMSIIADLFESKPRFAHASTTIKPNQAYRTQIQTGKHSRLNRPQVTAVSMGLAAKDKTFANDSCTASHDCAVNINAQNPASLTNQSPAKIMTQNSAKISTKNSAHICTQNSAQETQKQLQC